MSDVITAGELQQQFATLYGAEEGIIWDLYTKADDDLLKKKLEFLIPDVDAAAQMEELLNSTSNEKEKQKKANQILDKMSKVNAKLAEHRARLFDALWAQRKYNNGDLIMSIIFVMVTPKVETYTTYSLKKQTTFSCHPVFRVRKCKVDEDSENCCAIFVDEIGRVYQNWRDYVNNNSLPEGIMLAPESGYYKFNGANEVCLTTQTTPEASVAQKALKGTDIGATVLGVTSIIPATIGLFIPVTAPLVIASIVAGFGSGLWSVGRCIGQLADRGNHEESISMANREARSAWFGIAGGVVGMSAAGATQGLRFAATGGRDITRAAQIAVNSVNIASITVNGVGISNSAITLIMKKRDDERISAMEIMQLSASLVLFTHSIYNFKLVSGLQVSEEGGTMQQFRRMFSDAQRKVFRALGSNNRSGSAAIGGQGDIVREPGIIPDMDYSINYGEVAMRLATTYLQKVISSGFLTNPQEFKFCIMEMLKNLEEKAVDVLFDIAKTFLLEFIGRLVPFEHVVWRIYQFVKITFKIDDITGDFLKQKLKIILAELKKVYENRCSEDYARYSECKNCRGYYSIVAVK